jgi:uncharacterized protein YjbI with pentapeptide repeats
MKIESEKHRMEVYKSDLSGSKFDDVNLAGLKLAKVNLAGASFVDARLDGATIEGVPVTDLLAYWRAGHQANPA